MSTRNKRNHFWPTLERLEDRSVPSATPLGIGVNLPVTLQGMFANPAESRAPERSEAVVTELSKQQPTLSVSTIPNTPGQPGNGDLNPYGVAFVPNDIAGGADLHPGDVLVSNFNNSSNQQGTGTTIVRITPSGKQSVFFQQSGLGLTTALAVLKSGFVLVGSVPADANGNPTQGSLLILDSHGHEVAALKNAAFLDGPWDLTVNDQGNFAQVFVSNVLNGTVTRLDLVIPPYGKPHVLDMHVIASGYATHPDPAAQVVGPTGLAYNAATDTLYVASTADNAVYAISHAGIRFSDAGKGQLIFQDSAHLHGPLGLVLAPNGDLLASNGDAPSVNPPGPRQLANAIVEFTPTGRFVGQFSIDSGPPGAAFGIALQRSGDDLRFAAVNDNQNAVEVWNLEL